MAVDVEFLPSTNTNNINTNFERVKTALIEAVGRNGDLPNQMNADLDLNDNDLLNVGTIQAEDLSIDSGNVMGILERANEAILVAELSVTEAEAEADRAETEADRAETEANAAEAAAISLIGQMATSIQGRLSLTSNSPSPTSDVTGATSIFYVPNTGQYASVYNGTSFVTVTIGSQLTLPLNSNAGHAGYHAINNNFDLFIVNDSGTTRLVSGPSWTVGAVAGSDVSRGTGANSTELETFNGILVNKNSFTVRFGTLSGDTIVIPARRATYVGSFRASGNGETTDSKLKRFLFNAYNRLDRDLRVTDPTANWIYTTSTVRQARGNAANQVEFLHGLSGILVEADLSIFIANSLADATTFFSSGIGLDSTTAIAADSLYASGFFQVASRVQPYRSLYKGYPGLGYHRLTWLESATNGTATWYGNDFRSSLVGRFLG